MSEVDNRLIERLLQFKNANDPRIVRRGNTLIINDVTYDFPTVSSRRQNSTPYSR